MTFARSEPAGAERRQMLWALICALVVVGSLFAAFSMASGLLSSASAVAALRQRLADLDGRANTKPDGSQAEGASAAGSPFLEGPTITLAGAALQHWVERAVAKAGGALLSSQVDLDGPKTKDRFLSLTVNLEIPPAAIQSLLYDLESGAPYLFVDSLEVQGPQAFGEAENGRMRVTIALSGQWEPAR